MSWNHIHFCSKYPSDGPISGMRTDCDLFIEIDTIKAIKDGYKFYISTN